VKRHGDSPDEIFLILLGQHCGRRTTRFSTVTGELRCSAPITTQLATGHDPDLRASIRLRPILMPLPLCFERLPPPTFCSAHTLRAPLHRITVLHNPHISPRYCVRNVHLRLPSSVQALSWALFSSLKVTDMGYFTPIQNKWTN
jgi:hypothetical protein